MKENKMDQNQEQDQEELNRQNKATLRRAELAGLSPITYEELEAVFCKWMIIPDKSIIKFIVAFYCANRMPGKAIWAFLIGPSGGGKTEFLNALLDLNDIFPVSMLTSNTFLSGMPGRNDASLLPKLSGKIALFKDWTSILSMQKDAKAEIMSQFREIWDGNMKKIFGNGRVAEWNGKVSILAASTQAVDLNQQQYTHLGERFLNYRLVMPDRKEVALRSLSNSHNQEQMETELRNAMYAYLTSLDLSMKVIPQLPEEYRDQVVNLANFMTMARSGVIRDFGMKKEVIFVPAAEMPTRSTSQLAKLGSAMIIANKGIFKEEDMAIIYKIALDSIPQTNKMVIQEMAKADNQSTAEIATALGYPTEPIKMYLENLAMLKVCRRTRDNGNSYRWTMNEEFSTLVRHYEGIEELTEEEVAVRKADSSGPEDTDDPWAGTAYEEHAATA
jgi:hypothetical protein